MGGMVWGIERRAVVGFLGEVRCVGALEREV